MVSRVLHVLQVGCLVYFMFFSNLKTMIYPKRLSFGDEVRVVALARSLKLISKNVCSIANERFKRLGLKLSFGKHVNEFDDFYSTSIESRIEDLHNAFKDSNVKAIITVIGGFNSNQLLEFIDWNLVKSNPKIFCGFSDTTVLNNAILAKTGLVSYYGPHYSTFGQKRYFDYTLENFIKAMMKDNQYEILPSNMWSDDLWFKNQDSRKLIKNRGFFAINEGECEGTIIGGNLTALASLKGTEYFPNIKNTVLFIEDDEEILPQHFDRLLCSLIQIPQFEEIKGIVIGRLQNASKMSLEKLEKIIKTKQQLSKIPVVVNVDFGHTDPKTTFPIGGQVYLKVSKKTKSKILITKH